MFMGKGDHESEQTRMSYLKDLSGTLLALTFSFLTDIYWTPNYQASGCWDYGDKWLDPTLYKHKDTNACNGRTM